MTGTSIVGRSELSTAPPAALAAATAASGATRSRRAQPVSRAFSASIWPATRPETARFGLTGAFQSGAHRSPADRGKAMLTGFSLVGFSRLRERSVLVCRQMAQHLVMTGPRCYLSQRSEEHPADDQESLIR